MAACSGGGGHESSLEQTVFEGIKCGERSSIELRGAGLAAFAVSSICDNFFAPDVA